MSAPLWFSHPAALDHAPGEGHPERPARMTAALDALGRAGGAGWERRRAPAASLDALTAVHSARHVERVRSLEAAGGGPLDPVTVVAPGSWRAALHAAGGACAMVDALLSGDAAVAFSAGRPPGHHAAGERTSGFCLFNSIAIAARHALDAHGLARVLIVDWDVHHGDGTNDIFRRSDAVLFASIHQGGLFPGTGPLIDVGAGAGTGFSINLPVPAQADEDSWLSLLEWIVVPAAEQFRPQLILVSAGFDAHRDDPIADGALDAGSFGEMARHVRALGDRVGAPVGAVLEGGYALTALTDSVAATLEGLADPREPRSVSPDFATSRAASVIGHHWRL